jgi:hypothetical protein
MSQMLRTMLSQQQQQQERLMKQQLDLINRLSCEKADDDGETAAAKC